MSTETKAKEKFFSALEDIDRGDYDAAEDKLRSANIIYKNRESIIVNLSSVMIKVGKYRSCIELLKDYIKFNPNSNSAILNLAISQYSLNYLEEALSNIETVISMGENDHEVIRMRGMILAAMKRYADSIRDFEEVLSVVPGQSDVLGRRTMSKLAICDWSNYDAEIKNIIDKASAGEEPIDLHSFLFVPCNEKFRMEYAKYITRKYTKGEETGRWKQWNKRNSRIRVGYISADFRGHALSYLIAELLELHDIDRFEICAFSDSPHEGDVIQDRIRKSVHEFHDISRLEREEAASFIISRNIDIVIDLTGRTGFGRPEILSRRVAPIQVSYLGFAGTMGAAYYDYIIADRITIPDSSTQYFTEKVAWMPNTYQVTDTTREFSHLKVTRKHENIDERSFVYCCFNNAKKIEPEVFKSWMNILMKTEDSVLWLLAENDRMKENIIREAIRYKIGKERLIFAERKGHYVHLARHMFADLFLDTFICGAHTTASDALWAGVPVLTKMGDTFAGRVGASLNRAVGLDDLVVSTALEYESLAIELRQNSNKLHRFKEILCNNRKQTPLFDTKRFTRNLEAMLTYMQERQKKDLPPCHIRPEQYQEL